MKKNKTKLKKRDMKKGLLILIIALFATSGMYAQSVGINDDGSLPDGSAMLDVKSSDKGILIPRLDFNNKPASPATGLMIFVTANGPDGNNAYYFYNGSSWVKIGGTAGLMLTATYDSNSDNVVDNSAVVNNLTVQTAVPAGAVFTDDQTLSEILTTSTDAGANKITNLSDPASNQDAATKKYVDDEVSGVSSVTMPTATYDSNADNIVDNSAKVNNLTVQTAVPSGAVFTDDQTLSEILAANTSAGSHKITSLTNPTNPNDAATKGYVDMVIGQVSADQSNISGVPTGAVQMYGGSTPPSEWLLCDGSAVSRATYPILFNVIGIAFGAGDGSTTFNLPDMRGRFPRGANPTGANGAPTSNVGDFQDDLIQSHSHGDGTLTGSAASAGAHTHSHNHPATTSASSGAGNHRHSVSITSGNNSVDHDHNSTGSAGSHSHTMKQWRYNTLSNSTPGGNINLWQGALSTNLATNDAAGAHTHTTGMNDRDHTHLVSGNTGYANPSHSHSVDLANISSSSNGAHTHTVSVTGTTAASGSGTDTRPDNVTFIFIIKY